MIAIPSYADGRDNLIIPQFLAFKLLKEISQGNIACEPCSLVAAETPASSNTPIGLPRRIILHRHEGGCVKSGIALT